MSSFWVRIVFCTLVFQGTTCGWAGIIVEKTVVGFDGFVRGERWTPAVFDLRNTGPDFSGTLEVVKGETVYRKSVDLASGARKKIEIFYYHSNYYELLFYRLLDRLGRVVLTKHLEPRPLNYQDNLVLVISDGEYNHQFVNGELNPWGGKTFAAYLKPDELLSDWPAYGAADAIALGTLSPTSLPPEKWRNLLQYFAIGGLLVISAATSPGVLNDPDLRAHLPEIHPGFDRVSNAEFLASKWSLRFPGPFPAIAIPVQTIVPRSHDKLLQLLPDGAPLITSSSYYKGSIITFAFDYTRLPESVRPIFSLAWNQYLYPSLSGATLTFGTPYPRRLEENPRIQRFLHDIPGLHLPDMKWFALFFFVYLSVLGPVQFFILRVLKRNSLLFLSFPLIILVFSVASFGYSKFRHSNQHRITQIMIVELFPSLQREVIHQVYGTALADSGKFDIQAVPENSYLRKFVLRSLTYQPEPFTLSEDLPRELIGETMKNWTFRTFDAFSSRPLQTPVSLRITRDGQGLHGQVVNGLESAIKDAFFVFNSRNAVTLGTIAGHTTRNFSLVLNDSTAVPFAEPQLRELLNVSITSYNSPHFFFGRAEGMRGEIVINGKHRATACTKFIAVYAD